MFASALGARAHPEWNNLHLVYSAASEFTYPFDGRTPKIAAVALNHHDTFSPEITFTFSVNGVLQNTTAFPRFPDGGNILIAPQEIGFATVPTGAIYDGRAGAAPAVGETKSFAFHFDFALTGASTGPNVITPSNDLDDVTADPPGTVNATVKFTNLGDNPVLSGPVTISGLLRFPNIPNNPPAANVLVEVATPFSNWFKIPATPAPSSTAGAVYVFSQALPFRNDWILRFSADGYDTRTVTYGYPSDPHTPYDITMTRAPVPDFSYARSATIATPTGFWRGAVSESEGTFVAFPGQQTWPAAATDAASRALRTASRIVKCQFDGTKLWEHAPGWETGAGDMTPDGRYVAYALNPTATSFYTPTENKLVLLDGATGVPIWTKSGPPGDSAIGQKLASLELAFSPDGKFLAVGSVGGQVTLVDRASGNFLWSVPGGAPTFGEVRRLRFSGDGQWLFCGSGDTMLRKLRVSDGAVLWRVYVGAQPSLNGLDLSPDGAWVSVGTASLDTSLIRVSDSFTSWRTETQAVDAVMAPDGRHVATRGGQIIRALDGSFVGNTRLTGLPRFTGDGRWLFQLDQRFTVHDLGGKLLKDFGDTTLAAGSVQWAYVTRDSRYAILLARDLTAASPSGIVIFQRSATVPTRAGFLVGPLAVTATTGAAAALTVVGSGTEPLSYQWLKAGAEIPGATSAVLSFAAVSATDAASYTCVVSNIAGRDTTAPAVVSVVAPQATNPARLANLSVSARFAPGGPPLIAGFTIGGGSATLNKRLLLRAAGPSLAAFGVGNPLADPRLALQAGASVLATNDNWSGDAQISALGASVGAFPFASAASKDAALAALPVPGGYSLLLSSSDPAADGTALGEIYDCTTAFTADTPRLINLSARFDTGGPYAPLTAGFVIVGPAARNVLIRGVGPALAQFGVTNALADPSLTVFREASGASAAIALNDNWHDAPNAVALATTSVQVGAFALPPGSRDAALLLTLPPGNYSAQVTAPAGTTGNALVEIYEVP